MSLNGGWLAAIAAWDEYERVHKLRPETTRRTRREQLQLLGRTIGTESPWEVTADQLATWFVGRAWKDETRRSRRTTFRGFYAWGVQSGHVIDSPALSIPVVKASDPNPAPVPDSAWRIAYAMADTRERLMLDLAEGHGLRRAEVAVVWPERDLIEDLDGWSLLVHGKGGKTRVVPLDADVASTLRAMPAGWAFPGRIDGHLSPRWVGRVVADLLPGHHTMHKLRHRAASQVHEAGGGDLALTQDFLGHASPVTTRRYVKVRDGRMRAAIAKARAA